MAMRRVLPVTLFLALTFACSEASAMYEAMMGRFLSRDPIGFEGSPWNLYEYTGGNPVIYVDATGQACTLVGPGGPPTTSGTFARGAIVQPGVSLNPGVTTIGVSKDLQCCSTTSQDFGYACCCGWRGTKSGMSHTETTSACFTLKTKKIWFTFGIVITPPGIKFPILPAVEIHQLVGNDQAAADLACNAAAKAGKGVAPPAPAPPKTLPCP